MSNPKPTPNHPVGSPPVKSSAGASKGSSTSSSTHKPNSKSTSLPISKLIEAEKHIQQQQQRMQQQKQPQRIKPTAAPLHSHLPSSGSPSSNPPQKVISSHGSRGESSKLPELVISPGKPSTSNSSRSNANSSRASLTSASSEGISNKKRIIEVGKPNPQQVSSSTKAGQAKVAQSKASSRSKQGGQQKAAVTKSEQQKLKTASASTKSEKQSKPGSGVSAQSQKEFSKNSEKSSAATESPVHPRPPPSTTSATSSLPQKESPPKPPSKILETPAPRSSTAAKPSPASELPQAQANDSVQQAMKSQENSTSPSTSESQATSKPANESASQQQSSTPSLPSVHKPQELPQQSKPAPHPQANAADDSNHPHQSESTNASSTKEEGKSKPVSATKVDDKANKNPAPKEEKSKASVEPKAEEKAAQDEVESKSQQGSLSSSLKANELSTTATLSLSSAIQGAVTSASTEPDVELDIENDSLSEHHSGLLKRKKEPDVPMSEMADEMKTKTFNISTLFRMTFSDVKIELTPDFRDLDEKEFNTMFANKVKECKKICDWSIGIKDVEAKKNKKILLIQLIELFESKNGLEYILPQSINKFISMVVQNISRPFPPQKVINPLFDFDDVTQDMAWPHLALVYEALLKLLMSPISLKIKHPTFVSVLVKNSCSPDERERMAVRDNLKLLFVKCPDLQETILRLVQNQFLTGTCSHQILEFILAVLDEVGRPLPENLVNMYKNSILFLHSSKMFLSFYKAFFAVVNRFVRFERSLLHPTMEYLVKHWPSSTVRKQLVFMSEMEGLTLNYFEDVNEEIAKMVFQKLSELVNQPNIDIAETALNVLLGPALEEPLLNFPELAIKILTQELMNAANKNWNDYVQEDSKLALQMLSDLNPKAFKATVSKLKEERKKKKTYQGIWRTNWKKVVETAKLNDNTITSANMDMLF